MNQEKVAIIINSASYDRVAYALSIASTSAALGKEVHVLFSYGAIHRLVKGKADEIGEETPGLDEKNRHRGIRERFHSKDLGDAERL